MRSNRCPQCEPIDEYVPTLCHMVAQTSWLPNPETVLALGRAAIPTSRARTGRPRLGSILEKGKPVGMYDENTTPTWAMLWAHGIPGGKRTGWCFAHVWTAADDVKSYTNVANLAMVRECFAGLTDKDGPLTGYLRWHAWTVYKWKPDHVGPPPVPVGYNDIKWRYLPRCEDPRKFIDQQIEQWDNQRLRILREIMDVSHKG